ncbi:acyl-CoA synthetase [Aerococcaceae bacterium zg-BR22]|nr:acyl-CoA synthetase [Aerococcaceae bacterium zg-BR22]
MLNGGIHLEDIFPYTPLNLYQNYQEAALHAPDVMIATDTKLPAFPELSTETTYHYSHQIIVKRAHQLATFGIRHGDKVMIFKSPALDTYLLAVAVTYLGAVPVMVSYHLPPTTIETFIERLEQPFVLYDDETKPTLDAVFNLNENRQLNITELLTLEPTIIKHQPLPENEICYMTHTSGTTGIPKLICHSAQSMGWRTKWQKTVFNRIESKRPLAFHISPVHSRYNIGISSAMSLGFPLVALSNADFSTLERILQMHQPVALETHPNNFVRWAELAQAKPELFQKTRYYHSTFDAINYGTISAFLTASKAQAPIFLQVYGQSECGPMILRSHHLETLNERDARDMGVGLLDLTQARIADKDGNILPPNTDGHIHLYSKGRALTYYKESERFQKTVYGEWWDSGDYGCINEEGHLILKDRQVDVIEAISSNLAIEDFLLDNLTFLNEVVIVKGKENRAQPVITIKDNQTMDWDAWWQQVSDLPHLYKPIIMAWDNLPRTATMKVQRRQLETMISEQMN